MYKYSVSVQPTAELDLRVYLTDGFGVIWEADDSTASLPWITCAGEPRQLDLECEVSDDYYLIVVNQSGEGKFVVSMTIDVAVI